MLNRGSIDIVCNLSQCLSQIQEEAAAPPDGPSHVSRKTQTVVCFDRQENSFLLHRLLYFLPPRFVGESALSFLGGSPVDDGD